VAGELSVRWSAQADRAAGEMAAFIASQWTEKEVKHFLDLLEEFERRVVRFPFSFPASEGYAGCRRASIHRNASVVYRVDEGIIHIVTVVDNRSSKTR
jgi:plasmid stabilization system protein ParE